MLCIDRCTLFLVLALSNYKNIALIVSMYVLSHLRHREDIDACDRVIIDKLSEHESHYFHWHTSPSCNQFQRLALTFRFKSKLMTPIVTAISRTVYITIVHNSFVVTRKLFIPCLSILSNESDEIWIFSAVSGSGVSTAGPPPPPICCIICCIRCCII